jgi:carbon-monoxide dehydrogenase medium subunit
MFIRRLPDFEHHAPASLSEALDLLARYGGKAEVYAGGTDLLVAMKKREKTPEHLIDLKKIADLRGIRFDEKKGITIGALTTLEELERSTVVKEQFGTLWDALTMMASPQIRSLGTIGGNLCSALPSADTAPPLIVLGASAKVAGPDGERSILVEQFFRGPKEPALKRHEMLKELFIPKPGDFASGSYIKLMRRNAMDLALVGAAAYLRMDSKGKICKEARIALGSVAPTPIRVPQAEDILMNKEIEESRAAEAGKAASEACRPISDIRSSLAYRRTMVEVLTKRAVMEAYERSKTYETD